MEIRRRRAGPPAPRRAAGGDGRSARPSAARASPPGRGRHGPPGPAHARRHRSGPAAVDRGPLAAEGRDRRLERGLHRGGRPAAASPRTACRHTRAAACSAAWLRRAGCRRGSGSPAAAPPPPCGLRPARWTRRTRSAPAPQAIVKGSVEDGRRARRCPRPAPPRGRSAARPELAEAARRRRSRAPHLPVELHGRRATVEPALLLADLVA